VNRTKGREAVADRSKKCSNRNDDVKEKHIKKGDLVFLPFPSFIFKN
jgi:hypothetical protein